MATTKRWVWLDTATGKFTKSWDDEFMQELGALGDVELLLTINMIEENSTWKLISYEVHNDDEFVFNDHMRLV